MFLYFAAANVFRRETDTSVIATLLRKGWVQIPDPEVPGSTWNGIDWDAPPSEQVIPQWVQFGVALGSTAAVNVFVATLAQSAPVLHLMIGVGLGQASQGDPQTFLGGWSQCRALGLVSAELLAGVTAMAADYDLPADFIAALSD
jgi:hypothetical protein